MKKDSRRHPREQLETTIVRPEQQTMDDRHLYPSSTLLVQKFVLNSFHRSIARKGQGRKPSSSIEPSEALRKLSGRKCNNFDLEVVSQSFANYRKAVNLILEKVFSDPVYLNMLGEELDESRGMVYLVLRKEQRLKWTLENEFGQLVYERLFRNALETAARIIYGDHTRRRLVNSLLEILAIEDEQLIRLMKNRRIPSDLIRRVKDTLEKTSNGSYYYALSACRQVRKVLGVKVHETYSLKDGERRKSTRELLEVKSPERLKTRSLIIDQINEWKNEGFPFITPSFQKDTIDFAASTENTTGQGYWFEIDQDREDLWVLCLE